MLYNKRIELYDKNRAYYDHNADCHEMTSWYCFNKYKNDSVSEELRCCLKMMEEKTDIPMLEIGPGTGYLLKKILSIQNRGLHYKPFINSN